MNSLPVELADLANGSKHLLGLLEWVEMFNHANTGSDDDTKKRNDVWRMAMASLNGTPGQRTVDWQDLCDNVAEWHEWDTKLDGQADRGRVLVCDQVERILTTISLRPKLRAA